MILVRITEKLPTLYNESGDAAGKYKRTAAIRELVKTHGGFASSDEEEEIMDHYINQLGERMKTRLLVEHSLEGQP